MALMPVVLMIRTRRFGMEHGVRMEYAPLDVAGLADQTDILTGPEWCGANTGVRVVEWGADACGWSSGLQLHLVELETAVCEIKLVMYASTASARLAPNAPSEFTIQNACGSWDLPEPIDIKSTALPLTLSSAVLRRLAQPLKNKPKQPKQSKFLTRANQDSIHTISGTFVVSAHKHRVDFRGVRIFQRMLADWLQLLGCWTLKRMQQENITCRIYMVLLKGNLGYSLALHEPLNYVMLWTRGGWGHCRVRLADEHQVCDVLELINIEWTHALWAGEHATVRKAETTLEISRKGGAVVRVVFPKNTPWDHASETDVRQSCNILWGAMRRVLSGAPLLLDDVLVLDDALVLDGALAAR